MALLCSDCSDVTCTPKILLTTRAAPKSQHIYCLVRKALPWLHDQGEQMAFWPRRTEVVWPEATNQRLHEPSSLLQRNTRGKRSSNHWQNIGKRKVVKCSLKSLEINDLVCWWWSSESTRKQPHCRVKANGFQNFPRHHSLNEKDVISPDDWD